MPPRPHSRGGRRRWRETGDQCAGQFFTTNSLHKKVDLGHLEAGDSDVEIRLDGSLLELQSEQGRVPAGLFGEPGIGDHIGTDLGGTEMVHPDGRDVLHPQGYGGSDPGMAGDDTVLPVDQNRVDKPEFLDADADLFDLAACACADF